MQVYVRHPELAAAKANRDYVFKQVCEAVNTISDVAQGKGSSSSTNPFEGPGELAAALDDFDVRLHSPTHVFTVFVDNFACKLCVSREYVLGSVLFTYSEFITYRRGW